MHLIDVFIIGIGGGILAFALYLKGVETKFIIIACTTFGFVQGIVAGILHNWGM